MHHFTTATACCTPRRSISSSSPRRSARRSIAIPPRRCSGITRCSPRRSPACTTLICYAMKANSNQAVIATLARTRRRRRRRLRGRAAARARGRHPAGEDHVLRRRQDGGRDRARARDGHPLCQCRVRARTRAAVSDRGRQGAHRATSRCASTPTSMPGRTPRSRPARPRTSSAFPISRRARSMRAPPSCRASTLPASTCTSAARSPSCAVRRRVRAACRLRARAARGRPHHRATSISAAASAFPIAPTTSRRRIPAAYAAVVKRATRELGCKLIFEPGRLIVGNAGILVTRVLYVKQRRGQEFRHRRRGDERPDPPDPLRGAPRDPPGAGAAPARRASSRTWSVRSARSGDFLALDREMAEPQPGDLIAVMTAGAYGAVQAGTYNTRALVPEVLVNGARMGAGAAAPRCRSVDRT